jgi:hypothetical protein
MARFAMDGLLKPKNVAVLQLFGILILLSILIIFIVFNYFDNLMRRKAAAEQQASIDSLIASVGNGDAVAAKLADRIALGSTFQKTLKTYSTQSSQEALQIFMMQVARGNVLANESVISEMEKRVLASLWEEAGKLKRSLFTSKELAMVGDMVSNIGHAVMDEAKKAKSAVHANLSRFQVPASMSPADSKDQFQESLVRLEEINRKVDSWLQTAKNPANMPSPVMKDKAEEASMAEIRDMMKDLGEQIRFQARLRSPSTAGKQSKSLCYVLNWSKSLNVSPVELESLVQGIKSITGLEQTSPSSNSFLLMQDFSPKKVIKPFVYSEKALTAFLSGVGPSDGRPLADDLPSAVVDQVPGSAVGIDTLVLITGHEFRFKKEDLNDWNRFKTLILVLIEGPVPEYFEWTHIAKLKSQRQKVPGNITEIRVFKKQNDRGLSKDEVRDLTRQIQQSVD